MKLACNSFMIAGNTFKDKLNLMEHYGFEGVELRVLAGEATPQYLDEIEQALSESPIKPCSLIMPGPQYQLKFDSRESKFAKLEGARKALETGARFGVGAFVTVEYSPQSPIPLWYRRQALSGLERDLFYEFMSEVAEYAEKISAVALIEPINRYETHFYHSVGDVKEVIDQVGSNRLKIVADFFHMSIEEADIAASLKKNADYIQHIQLGDSNRELPGKGHTDFASGFAALQKIGYQGYLAIECRIPDDPDVEFPECVEYLKRCLEESKIC